MLKDFIHGIDHEAVGGVFFVMGLFIGAAVYLMIKMSARTSQ